MADHDPLDDRLHAVADNGPALIAAFGALSVALDDAANGMGESATGRALGRAAAAAAELATISQADMDACEAVSERLAEVLNPRAANSVTIRNEALVAGRLADEAAPPDLLASLAESFARHSRD